MGKVGSLASLGWLLLAAIGVLGTSVVHAIDLGPAAPYNGLLFKHWSAPSSYFQGRLAARGDTSLNHYSIGDGLDPASAASVLIAGGSTAGIGDPVVLGMTPGTQILAHAVLPMDFGGAYTYLRALSSELATRTANTTYEYPWGGLYLHGECSGDPQVFDLDSGQVLATHTFKKPVQ